MGIFAQALTKPHAKQAVFQAMKRVIIDGDMYGRTDMEGAQQVYEQSVTGNTAKGFRSFYTRGLRSFYDPDYNNLSAQEFGNTKAQSVIFSHLDRRTKSATFTDFYTAFTLPDILRIVSELSPEERVFLKDAYTQYKNFYFANKAKIDALVQEQERLNHIYKDREEEMDTLWRRHAFSERYDSLEMLISEETKKDQPDLNLLTQYMDEQNEI